MMHDHAYRACALALARHKFYYSIRTNRQTQARSHYMVTLHVKQVVMLLGRLCQNQAHYDHAEN